MKLDEVEVRLLLDAVLHRAEAAEKNDCNPFAWTRLASDEVIWERGGSLFEGDE